MIEDKLDKDERIRLECLAQANAMLPDQAVDHILKKAKRFEAYVREGKTD